MAEDSYITDAETGETDLLPKGTIVMTPEEVERRKSYAKLRQEQAEEKRKLAAAKDRLCGDFVWSLYKVGEEYHPNVSDSLLTKIIYLLTYLDYNSSMLVVREGANQKYRPMKKADVRNLIQLHRSKFDAFWGQVLETGIITEDSEGKLIVDSSFRKGALGKRDREGQAAIKLFTHAVRYLYENTDVRSHKYLSYFYRLIPYINLKYNIVCRNPLEDDGDLIDKITIKDICHILGVDESNQTRLKNALFSLRFVDKNGDERSVITIVTNYKNDERRDFVLINPQFYSGYMPKNDLLDEIKLFARNQIDHGI